MTKVVKKISLRKGKHRIPKRVIHIQANFNNTIVIIIDIRGQDIFWSSVGACGFRGMKKNTPFVAQTAVKNVIRMLIDQGMKQIEVMISGSSPRRDTTLRTIRRSGVILNFVRDVTPMPHNGCRPPKKKRV